MIYNELVQSCFAGNVHFGAAGDNQLVGPRDIPNKQLVELVCSAPHSLQIQTTVQRDSGHLWSLAARVDVVDVETISVHIHVDQHSNTTSAEMDEKIRQFATSASLILQKQRNIPLMVHWIRFAISSI